MNDRAAELVPVNGSLFAFDEALHFEPCSTWAVDFHAAILRHYTDSDGAPPGKKMGWRVWERGRLVGWIGLGEPPYKLAARRRIGLQDARPLPQTVCCFIYRLERHSGSAGDILRAWHLVASEQWRTRYGWSPVHWETMVSQGDAGNLGACFKRAGYRRLGETTGWGARRPEGNTHGPRVWEEHGIKRVVLYRGPLSRLPR
jgi:hypothetical protein